MVTREIVDHLCTQILAETGLDERQVHTPHDYDTPVGDLPEIVVFSLEDHAKAEEDVDSNGGQERVFTFGVTISVGSEDEASTDELARLVRKAVLQDCYMGGLVLSTYWDSTEWGRGSQTEPVQMAKQTFHANYQWSPEW